MLNCSQLYFPKAAACALLCVVAMSLPTSARAQGAQSIAVLNIEGEGVDRDTANALSALVRNEAQQLASYRVVNSTPINLSEVLVLLGCDVSSPDCLLQAANQLDANTLIYGRIAKEQDESFRLRLAIFDANTLTVTHRMQEVFAKDDDLIFEASQEIEFFFKDVKAEQDAAKLTIASNVRGAQVLLNGESRGVTPLDDLSVTPGTYAIEVKKEGFTSWSVEMELAARDELNLRAPLKPLSKGEGEQVVEATPPKENATTVITTPSQAQTTRTPGGGLGEDLDVRGQRDGVNIGAVSLLAIGGASLIASGITAARMDALSRDLTDRANRGDLTPTEREQGIDQGLALQRVHLVLLGAGVVAGVVGGGWILYDLTRPDESAPSVSVKLSPTSIQGVVRW